MMSEGENAVIFILHRGMVKHTVSHVREKKMVLTRDRYHCNPRNKD